MYSTLVSVVVALAGQLQETDSRSAKLYRLLRPVRPCLNLHELECSDAELPLLAMLPSRRTSSKQVHSRELLHRSPPCQSSHGHARSVLVQCLLNRPVANLASGWYGPL